MWQLQNQQTLSSLALHCGKPIVGTVCSIVAVPLSPYTYTQRHIHTAPAIGRIQVRPLVEFPSNSPDLLLPSAEILPMGTSEQVSTSTPAMGLDFNWN